MNETTNEKKEFLSKEDMKKILLLCFLVIVMITGFLNLGTILKGLKYIFDLVLPFVIGGAIAFIINVPMKKIEGFLFKKKPSFKGKRIISYIISVVLIIGILTLAMFGIVPELINTIKQLTNQLPAVFERVQGFISEKTVEYPALKAITENMELDYTSLISKISKLVGLESGGSELIDSTMGFISSVIGGFATFFIAIAFSIYVIARKEDLGRHVRKVLYAFFPEKGAEKILAVAHLSSKTFSNFLTGQCLEACILGIMFFIMMSIFKFPYALLISVLITITALVPIFGAFIGCGVGALLILFVDVKQAIIFVVMFIILQQIEGNFIYPHVVGSSVGLPSIWVLVAITVGAGLMGIIGMIIFIPLCSVLYSLFRELVNNRLKKKGIKIEDTTISENENKEKEKLKEKTKVKKT
ncbi:MAG: AI-2E family transporter [Ruminococcaceae bacterium]|nr:AI-2E family transporter [Oscillospiraceae bacterium]